MSEKLIQKIIFGKYKILKLLGYGSFGAVYKGINIKNGENVAIKIEEWKKTGDLLEGEAYFLFNLKGNGVPEVKSFGRFGKYKILVETLLGDSLDEISNKINKNFSLKDICMIGIQLIERLEYIHSKYIVHRDIKPENLLVDKKTKRIIYLIDFGLSKKYRSERTGKHIKYFLHKKMTGTARYASRNAIRGGEQSRRDDLECTGYVLIYLAKNNLPWQGLKEKDESKRFKQIYIIKQKIKPEILCSALPNEFCEYIKYIKKLQFEEDPNYEFLKGLFLNVLIRSGLKNDLNFSWLSNEEKIYTFNHIKISQNKKKRTSPQVKLLRNIENMEKEKSMLKSSRNSSSNNNIFININSRDNLNNIEKNKEKSISQLSKLNESVNIEEDEIINEEDTKNKFIEKKDNIINKDLKNHFEENINKEIKKANQKKIRDSNIEIKNDNYIQSIPIKFDPLNGSFNYMPVIAITLENSLNKEIKPKESNSQIKNINENDNKKNKCIKTIDLKKLEKKKEIKTGPNHINKIKDNIIMNNPNSHDEFFKNIKYIENKNDNHKILCEDNRNSNLEFNSKKQKKIPKNNYILTRNTLNNNIIFNNTDKVKMKFINNQIIEIKKNSYNSQKNNNSLDSLKKIKVIKKSRSNNLIIHKNESKIKINNKKNMKKNNNKKINDKNKRLIVNINLNNNIINKKREINEINSGIRYKGNERYLSYNNSFNKKFNIMIKDIRALNLIRSTNNFNLKNNMKQNNKLCNVYTQSEKTKNNLKNTSNMNLLKNVQINTNLYEYKSPKIITQYKTKTVFNSVSPNTYNKKFYNINSNSPMNNTISLYKKNNTNPNLIIKSNYKYSYTKGNINNKRFSLLTNKNNITNDFFQQKDNFFMKTERNYYIHNYSNKNINKEFLYPKSAYNSSNNSNIFDFEKLY